MINVTTDYSTCNTQSMIDFVCLSFLEYESYSKTSERSLVTVVGLKSCFKTVLG